MQIKTTIRYRPTLARMAAILKSLQTINVRDGVKKWEPYYTVSRMKTIRSTMENSVEIP